MANLVGTTISCSLSSSAILSPLDFYLSGSYVRISSSIPKYAGYFTSDAAQTASSNTSEQAILLPITQMANGVSMVSGSRITVDTDGVYNLQWSLQFSNNDTSKIQDAGVWVKKTGSNMDHSYTVVSIPQKHNSVNGYSPMALNFFVPLSASQYCELYWWASDSTHVTMDYIATQSNPTRPAAPAAIVTINKL